MSDAINKVGESVEMEEMGTPTSMALSAGRRQGHWSGLGQRFPARTPKQIQPMVR